ncbi:hypothetical protein [Kitasatospora azatica]|uniref:hypothetical protein n=1 Tax=Kitasatospora azatica TaxID=58347 RepID=UPI00055E2411|nr:hypothetical protein [Kitasatospora azatica]
MLSEQEITRGHLARVRWRQLPVDTRRQVLRQARRGRPIADPNVAAVAVGWAWQVLGEPGPSRPKKRLQGLWFLAEVFMAATGGARPTNATALIDGDEEHDANLYVRWLARQIERANPVYRT